MLGYIGKTAACHAGFPLGIVYALAIVLPIKLPAHNLGKAAKNDPSA